MGSCSRLRLSRVGREGGERPEEKDGMTNATEVARYRRTMRRDRR